MATASDQIAAVPKRSRAKVPPKTCGVPDCHDEVATGARLRLTVLEPITKYPAAVEGKISTCKAHRRCVGIQGYSTEITQGSKVFQACGLTAKIFYNNLSFCEACHNTFLEALVTLIKPRLTSDQINSVRDQIANDSKVGPAPSAVDPQPVKVAAEPKVKTPAPKKAEPSSASAAKPVPKKATPPPPPPPAVEPNESAEEEEEASASASHSATEDEKEIVPAPKQAKQAKPVKAPALVVTPPPPVVSAVAVTSEDPFKAMEEALSKEDKATAVVTGHPVPNVVKDPVKPVVPKAPRKVVATKVQA